MTLLVSTVLLLVWLDTAVGLSAANITQTAKNTADRLTPKGSVPFQSSPFAGVATIVVDQKTKFQTIEGWGAAFTDSTAYVFSGLPSELQEQVVEAYFGPTTGHAYTLGRLTMGSCDFTHDGSYSYNDEANDFNLTHFTIEHDKQLIIPLVKRAMAKRGPELRFFASPWSAPAWMKRNHNMRNSERPGLIQEPDIFRAWALYFHKYIAALEAEGVALWGITVQNEPHVSGQFLVTYECMGFNGTDEGKFLADYLGPLMRQKHPNVKIMVHDDQKELLPQFLHDLFAVPNAAQYVDGIAFHWYGDFLKNYQYLNQTWATYKIPMLATEATLEAGWKQTDKWAQGAYYATDIIGDLNNYAVGWVDWNFLLEWEGGPQHALGPCDAPITTCFLDNTCIQVATLSLSKRNNLLPLLPLARID
jgi:glucosylceramidase